MKNKLFTRTDGNAFKLLQESTYQTELTRVDPETNQPMEICILVKYEYLKGGRGEREKSGAQIEPDLYPSIDIEYVIDISNKNRVDLTSEEEARVQQEILDSLES
jgi:hypothetical protein